MVAILTQQTLLGTYNVIHVFIDIQRESSGQSGQTALSGYQEDESRILVIAVSPDRMDQYISTMNCIFAAQTRLVRIDAVVIDTTSAYLQQAAGLTGGLIKLYFVVENKFHGF